VLRQAVVAGLTGCATAEQLAAKKSDASVTVRLVAVVALRRQAAPAVAGFLNDSDGLVVEEAARAIHDDLSIPAALPALAALLERNPKSEVVARRAMNASLRVGTPETATRLLNYALNDATSQLMRQEALTTLRLWKNPPRLDLVDGRARTITPAAIESVLTPKLDALLALKDPSLKTLAVEIMIAHSLKAGAERIAAIVTDNAASGELRAQALRLMAGEDQKAAGFKRAVDAALAANSPAPLHRAALSMLLPGQADRLVKEAGVVLTSRTVAEKQYAIGLLAQAGTPAADNLLATLADAMVSGKGDAALKLDVIEALRARSAGNQTLAAKLQTYSTSPDAAAQTELLAGGDLTRGRDIVANHLNANCTACHSVENAGGSEVGPNLRTIGAQRDPAYLLQALVNPSAAIATGYGIVNVTLKNKTEVTGTLAKETPDAVTVRMFDGKMQTIKRADIANQTAPVSIMPPMQGILQPREIRDVVAYLSSLKGGGRNRAAKSQEGQ
jgi:putative heme-binding domain-containing protein